MTPLDGYSIAFVAEERANVLRAEGLRLAGASVRVCIPQLDLWTTLGDGSYDLLVLLASEAEPTVPMLLDAFEDDPRTRELPVLVLVHPALAHGLVRDAGTRCVTVLSAAASDDVLVRAVVQLAQPQRRLSEAHRQQRLQHDQLHAIVQRADEARVDLERLKHDIRALLGIVFGFACNLRDEIAGSLTVEQADYVARIAEASRDATALLDRTRGAERVIDEVKQSSAPPPARAGGAQRSRLDLAVLIESVVRLLEPSAQAQAKRISCELEQVHVWGDVLKLRQVVTNLLTNGLKYSPPGDTVSVRLRWAKGEEEPGPAARRRAEIVVSNSGPPIPTEFRERIFEPGFRLDEHAHLAGRGIGLSIVHEVVTYHGGEVRAEDRSADGGTSFVVTLPVDMRARAQQFGLLLAPEVGLASRLLDAIRARSPAELRAILADTPHDFLRMAATCGAAIVIPRECVQGFSEEVVRLLMPATEPTARDE